ncbi:transketolase [Brucepastera parasyntrophica]|uniref:transketolase n=1 Tax=Brucepastera parasyntrophica TaxID=2880008 RepID=UPI00210E6821|nr:transketolase [Brucepastera parasyntrophica]ULQ60895.1 transketolase [Brucepastera parasyntrophica]
MNTLDAVALSIRSLSMDAIEKAKSGHPGLPLGAAELAAILYGKILKHNPADPAWADRDRFVLSAGHGSMFLYSILHISGYDLSLDDIREFRQIGSKCPGHPEYDMTDGVEMTTGPLGQGVSSAVGMAIAETMLAAKYNTPEHTIVDHYTYALVGEGCLMEGVTSESASLAGHYQLDKLIVFYDENRVCIDGPTDMTFTEDIAKRYEAYGWQVYQGSMYNYDEIEDMVNRAKKGRGPSLIMLKSMIGKGAECVVGSSKAHGAPIGEKGIAAAKEHLGLDPETFFYVDPKAYAFFEERKEDFAAAQAKWEAAFQAWSKANPEKRAQWDEDFMNGGIDPEKIPAVKLPEYKEPDVLATRTASGAALNEYAKMFPNIVGGSADLSAPNAVTIDGAGVYGKDCRDGRYFHFGIREMAMAAAANGIQLHGGFRAYCATFLIFADYLRPALRLSALMKQPVIYVFSHDSIYVGEDGPTHQPVETLASLRIIPNVMVLRPGDAEEAPYAWKIALTQTDKPVCIILTRQPVPVFPKADPDWRHTIECGAYIALEGGHEPEITILATGSEVSMAINAAKLVPEKKVRVISVMCKELFESQPEIIRNSIIGGKKGSVRIVTAEAGVKTGWEGWTASREDIFSIDRFGESGPAGKLGAHFGFTAEKLAELLRK